MRQVLKALMIAGPALWLTLPAAAESEGFASPAQQQLYDQLHQTESTPPLAEVISGYPAGIEGYPAPAAAAWREIVLSEVDDAAFYDSVFRQAAEGLSETEAQAALDHLQSPAGQAITAAEAAFDENPDGFALAGAATDELAAMPETERAVFDDLARLQFHDSVLAIQIVVLEAIYNPVLGEADTAAYVDEIRPLLTEQASAYLRAESYVTYRDLEPEHLAAHTAFLETAAGKAYIDAFWGAYEQSYRQTIGQAGKDFAAALAQ